MPLFSGIFGNRGESEEAMPRKADGGEGYERKGDSR